MFGLVLLLLTVWTALIVVGAVVPGLFALSLIGLALFTGTALLGMVVHRPRHLPF